MKTVTNHQIKVSRALKQAKVGAFPQSASAMLQAIPASARDTLTSAQLAELLDAMWSVAETSKSRAAREVVDEGGVWDARGQSFRELQEA
ncbi:hypothetical protein [Tranquillimonas alkanivorans]|uniref:Uncharacterized protein n=1 Tax=Tranquillimonas alkanivorans TaxID=441119 RepID=A0A1I5TTI7_9RHOB|nr:hypothetical protein [Tranquillimonas alkanivorans]SFP86298.1 hypothetical protein SAMN04488047_11517 [Tranquillimonas alkanivorans]